MLRTSILALSVLLAPRLITAQQCANPNGGPIASCVATDNSSCLKADMCVSGDFSSFTLHCFDLPPNKSGIFFYSDAPQMSGGLMFQNGSNLCLAGSPAQGSTSGLCRLPGLMNSGPAGTFSKTLSGPNGVGAGTCMITAGKTWYFSAWYRDGNSAGTCNPGAPSTNFANGWGAFLN